MIPAELSLSGARTGSAAPSRAAANVSPPAAAVPTQQFENLNVNNQSSASPSPAPPSYNETPAPSLPSRNSKPIIAHARALYRYAATDARDLSFEKDDKISVHEYMNQDWWMGKNESSGQEGIFPRNYVLVEQENKSPAPPQQYGYPNNGPPAQQNPYDANVPPMAVAEGGSGGQGNEKVNQYGKKFGKKLGNAAIFGAGATIGGNIVNSIF